MPLTLPAAGAYALALILTLWLASWLTPPAWWRRPNLRALAILVAGCWGGGQLLLALARPAPAVAAVAVATPAPPLLDNSAATGVPAAGQPFRVHRALNLRSGAGTGAARLLTVPAGASVTPTGLREGDWWQLQTELDGRRQTGWASSLWLRRSGE